MRIQLEALRMCALHLSVETGGCVVACQDGLALTSDLSMKTELLEQGRILRAEVIQMVLCVCA